MDEIRLETEACVPEKVQIDASSEAIEAFPIRFAAGWSKLTDDGGCEGIVRMRAGFLVDGAD